MIRYILGLISWFCVSYNIAGSEVEETGLVCQTIVMVSANM